LGQRTPLGARGPRANNVGFQIASPWRLDLPFHAPKHLVSWLFAARSLILPTVKFGPQDADIIRGVDANPDPVAFDLDYGKGDAIADDYFLARLPAQNQHVTPP